MLCSDCRRRQHQTTQKDLWLLDMFLEMGTSVKTLISPLSASNHWSLRIHYREAYTLGWRSGEPQADTLSVYRQGDSHRYRLSELSLVSVLIFSQTLSGGTHEYSPCCNPSCPALQLVDCAHALLQRADTPHSFLMTPGSFPLFL